MFLGLFILSALTTFFGTRYVTSIKKGKSIQEVYTEHDETQEEGKYNIERILKAIQDHSFIKEGKKNVNKEIKQAIETTFDIQQKFQVIYVTLKDLERIRSKNELSDDFSWDELIKKNSEKRFLS